MVRALVPVLPLLALAGCAAPEPQRSAAAAAPAGAAGAVDCIDLSSVTARRAEGPDSIHFELLGGRAYRNRLPGSCPGLDRSRDFGALAFEVQGNRLCRGDIVRAVDPQVGGYAQSVPCVLGRFEPVAPEPRR